MYKTLLFDLDGTLTDPFEGITNSIVYSLSRFGISVADKRELIDFIGPPLVVKEKSFWLRPRNPKYSLKEFYTVSGCTVISIT